MKKLTIILTSCLIVVSMLALPIETRAKTISQFEAEAEKLTKELEEQKSKLVTNEKEIKEIKAKIILLISRFATLENKDFYVQNDYGILAYMCINEVMEYWWLETGQCLQVSKLDPISKSVR